MSKLGALVAIPLGFALVRSLVSKIPDDTTPIVPLIPKLPPSPIVIPPQTPTKIKIDVPEDIVPFFPETAVTAGKEFAEKKPFEFGVFPKIPETGLPTDFKIDWTSRPTD